MLVNRVKGCVWVPKTTLIFSDSLEGLTELRNAVLLTVHYRRRIQTGTSKRTKRRERRPGEMRHSVPVVHARGAACTATSHQCSNNHVRLCVQTAVPWLKARARLQSESNSDRRVRRFVAQMMSAVCCVRKLGVVRAQLAKKVTGRCRFRES